ncbi:MarR family winged helix-turn-helix transcriptional regulator [Achromobacter insuavis]|uniref:MarR family regulatory helix-turn-helix protein 19 n=1 Tax=Achromobacter insuavis AXX-A TaxID=1003200 RepID=F7SX07_9BURK|nr:MarR family transcriptional regulator [Achromobacter insuavis]EGP47344.1 MarR family regulatory helix-turn-helix protein 19 [Achromobacter insuavis AXX-A]
MTAPRSTPRPASPRALREFDLTQVASHLLRRAHFRAEALFAQAFPDEDLTPRQKALLITVHQNPGATQSRIAELIALDRNSFAEMIARMTAKGYVRRTRSAEDGRAYALEITDEGMALLARVLPRDAQVEAQVLAPIPEELRPVFLQCLRLMAGLEPPAGT